MVKEFLSSLKFSEFIKAAKTNIALIALVFVCLTIMFLIVTFCISGIARWILDGVILAGFLIFAFRRTHPPVVLPSPAGQDYLEKLLDRGFIYGDDGKLISQETFKKLEAIQLNPKLLPPPKKEDEGSDSRGGNQR